MDRYDGFHEFVHARSSALMRTAFLLTGDAHLAEDLLQAALTSTARHWPSVQRGGSPEAYVRRAMVNEHISWWRRRKGTAVVPVEEPPEPAAGGGHEEGVVRRVALENALALLTRKQRAVLVLRFYDDLSEAETAAMLGCSAGTVKSQTHHALARLREVAPELAGLLHDRDPMEVTR